MPGNQVSARRNHVMSVLVLAGAVCIGIVTGLSAAGSGNSGAPAPAVTVTRQARAVPGPAVTVTAPAPKPAAGALLGTFKGTGSQATPAFRVPDSGSFEVTWAYSGNTDDSFGTSQPTNFSVNDTGSGFGDLPDDIAASGHGSTVVTGVNGSTDRLNVQARGSWVLTVRAA